MRFTRPCLQLWKEKRTCKWLNHSFVSNKYVSQKIHPTIKAKKLNFENLLGWSWQVFKNHNCNPFQYPSNFSIRLACFTFYDVLFMPSLLTVRAVIFVSPRENRCLLVSLNHVAVYSLNLDKLRDIVHTVSLMAANLYGTFYNTRLILNNTVYTRDDKALSSLGVISVLY